MAKKNKNKQPTVGTSKKTAENSEIEKSDVVLSEVKVKPSKEDKEKLKKDKKNNKAKAKKAKNDKPKRNFFKSTFSELKKVSWPTFKQTCAKTGAVLAIVFVFMLVVLGLDWVIAKLISLILV